MTPVISGTDGSVRFSRLAGEDDAGKRIDVFLAARIPDLSRGYAQSLIANGAVKAGGVVVT